MRAVWNRFPEWSGCRPLTGFRCYFHKRNTAGSRLRQSGPFSSLWSLHQCQDSSFPHNPPGCGMQPCRFHGLLKMLHTVRGIQTAAPCARPQTPSEGHNPALQARNPAWLCSHFYNLMQRQWLQTNVNCPGQWHARHPDSACGQRQRAARIKSAAAPPEMPHAPG